VRYREAVHYLYSLGNEVHTAKLGLERISALLDVLGNPQRSVRFIHVAGTNGKGSTCAMIEAGLRARGRRTGLYTSPHLVEPTERIQIAGRQVSEEEFAAAFATVHEAAEGMLAAGTLDLHPTYFETVTAMAFLLFRDRQVEIAVLETGLGGRLDATNVARPEVCVITPIDYDHQNFLGDTIEEIAGEKAGILKEDVFAVFAAQRPEALRVLMGKAEALSCPVVLTSDWRIKELELRADGCRIRTDGVTIDCPLAGEHQVENALAAAIALDLLGVDPAGIADTVWPGRLELVRRNPDMVLDGAHNPAGARALAAYIDRFYGGRTVWLVFATMRDKPVAEMAGILFPLADRVILTTPDNSRALPADELRAYAPEGSAIAQTVAEAVELAFAAPTETAVFFAGSLFLAGEARALLKLQ
jgi:dihydrofolate synthase/folylpolyglutamate synthase